MTIHDEPMIPDREESQDRRPTLPEPSGPQVQPPPSPRPITGQNTGTPEVANAGRYL